MFFWSNRPTLNFLLHNICTFISITEFRAVSPDHENKATHYGYYRSCRVDHWWLVFCFVYLYFQHWNNLVLDNEISARQFFIYPSNLLTLDIWEKIITSWTYEYVVSTDRWYSIQIYVNKPVLIWIPLCPCVLKTRKSKLSVWHSISIQKSCFILHLGTYIHKHYTYTYTLYIFSICWRI